MIREPVLNPSIVDRFAALFTIPVVFVELKFANDLGIATHQDPVGPSWSSLLRRCIIDVTIIIVLVGWIKVKMAFVELF